MPPPRDGTDHLRQRRTIPTLWRVPASMSWDSEQPFRTSRSSRFEGGSRLSQLPPWWPEIPHSRCLREQYQLWDNSTDSSVPRSHLPDWLKRQVLIDGGLISRRLRLSQWSSSSSRRSRSTLKWRLGGLRSLEHRRALGWNSTSVTVMRENSGTYPLGVLEPRSVQRLCFGITSLPPRIWNRDLELELLVNGYDRNGSESTTGVSIGIA